MGRVSGACHNGVLARWLLEAERVIVLESERLCALDAALGDGDHGTNMARGFQAVGDVVRADGGASAPGPLLTDVGKTLISTIGGASGALWGFAFRRAGRALGEATTIGPGELAAILDAMTRAVVDLGEAQPGDKTMLDALGPAAAAFRSAVDGGASTATAARAAADAARRGADATAAMEARIGRASFLGPRSLGHQDPSANSVAVVIEALATTLDGPAPVG